MNTTKINALCDRVTEKYSHDMQHINTLLARIDKLTNDNAYDDKLSIDMALERLNECIKRIDKYVDK